MTATRLCDRGKVDHLTTQSGSTLSVSRLGFAPYSHKLKRRGRASIPAGVVCTHLSAKMSQAAFECGTIAAVAGYISDPGGSSLRWRRTAPSVFSGHRGSLGLKLTGL